MNKCLNETASDVNVNNELKFISWNPDGLMRLLKTNSRTLNSFTNFDFIAIYETWSESKDDLQNLIPNYRNEVNCARRYSKHGRAGGGIVLYYRDKYSPGVRRIYHEFPYAIICRLQSCILKIQTDVILICSYLPPEGANDYVYQSLEQNGVEILHELMIKIRSEYPSDAVLLMGDLNARVGQENDFIDDNVTHMSGMEWYIEDSFHLNRASRDKNVNSFGKSLLNLCVTFDIHLLNGRIDKDIGGEFTNITQSGCSVVDYVVMSSNMVGKVCSFEILNRCDFGLTNHFPVYVSIQQDNTDQMGQHV